MEEHYCRICGLYIEDKPWGKDGNCPTYEICPCCGIEFGNEDYTIESAIEYRKQWLTDGAQWFNPKEKPKNWNLENQLLHIPEKYR